MQAWEVGRRLELVIVNFGAEQRQVIESLAPLAWDVVGLNLEDAFVDYTRGPRRSLPVFDQEPTEGQPSHERSRSRMIMSEHKLSLFRSLLWATTLAIGFGTIWAPLVVWLGTTIDTAPPAKDAGRNSGRVLVVSPTARH